MAVWSRGIDQCLHIDLLPLVFLALWSSAQVLILMQLAEVEVTC